MSTDDCLSFKGQMAARYKERTTLGLFLPENERPASAPQDNQTPLRQSESSGLNTSSWQQEQDPHTTAAEESDVTSVLNKRPALKDLISSFESRNFSILTSESDHTASLQSELPQEEGIKPQTSTPNKPDKDGSGRLLDSFAAFAHLVTNSEESEFRSDPQGRSVSPTKPDNNAGPDRVNLRHFTRRANSPEGQNFNSIDCDGTVTLKNGKTQSSPTNGTTRKLRDRTPSPIKGTGQSVRDRSRPFSRNSVTTNPSPRSKQATPKSDAFRNSPFGNQRASTPSGDHQYTVFKTDWGSGEDIDQANNDFCEDAFKQGKDRPVVVNIRNKKRPQTSLDFNRKSTGGIKRERSFSSKTELRLEKRNTMTRLKTPDQRKEEKKSTAMQRYRDFLRTTSNTGLAHIRVPSPSVQRKEMTTENTKFQTPSPRSVKLPSSPEESPVELKSLHDQLIESLKIESERLAKIDQCQTNVESLTMENKKLLDDQYEEMRTKPSQIPVSEKNRRTTPFSQDAEITDCFPSRKPNSPVILKNSPDKDKMKINKTLASSEKNGLHGSSLYYDGNQHKRTMADAHSLSQSPLHPQSRFLTQLQDNFYSSDDDSYGDALKSKLRTIRNNQVLKCFQEMEGNVDSAQSPQNKSPKSPVSSTGKKMKKKKVEKRDFRSNLSNKRGQASPRNGSRSPKQGSPQNPQGKWTPKNAHKNRSPCNIPKRTSPYSTPKQRSPSNTPKLRSPNTTLRSRSPINRPRSRSPLNLPRNRSPNNMPKQISPTYAGKPSSPANTLAQQSSLTHSAKQASPRNILVQKSPLTTPEQMSSNNTPKNMSPLHTPKQRSPLNIAKQRSPINTSRPMSSPKGSSPRFPNNATKAIEPPEDSGRLSRLSHRSHSDGGISMSSVQTTASPHLDVRRSYSATRGGPRSVSPESRQSCSPKRGTPTSHNVRRPHSPKGKAYKYNSHTHVHTPNSSLDVAHKTYRSTDDAYKSYSPTEDECRFHNHTDGNHRSHSPKTDIGKYKRRRIKSIGSPSPDVCSTTDADGEKTYSTTASTNDFVRSPRYHRKSISPANDWHRSSRHKKDGATKVDDTKYRVKENPHRTPQHDHLCGMSTNDIVNDSRTSLQVPHVCGEDQCAVVKKNSDADHLVDDFLNSSKTDESGALTTTEEKFKTDHFIHNEVAYHFGLGDGQDSSTAPDTPIKKKKTKTGDKTKVLKKKNTGTKSSGPPQRIKGTLVSKDTPEKKKLKKKSSSTNVKKNIDCNEAGKKITTEEHKTVKVNSKNRISLKPTKRKLEKDPKSKDKKVKEQKPLEQKSTERPPSESPDRAQRKKSPWAPRLQQSKPGERRHKSVPDHITSPPRSQASPSHSMVSSVSTRGAQSATSRRSLSCGSRGSSPKSHKSKSSSPSKTPKKFRKLKSCPEYFPVKKVKTTPTPDFPVWSRIPVITGPVSPRDARAQHTTYRRWRDRFLGLDHSNLEPSQLPVSCEFWDRLETAEAVETSLHQWSASVAGWAIDDADLSTSWKLLREYSDKMQSAPSKGRRLRTLVVGLAAVLSVGLVTLILDVGQLWGMLPRGILATRSWATQDYEYHCTEGDDICTSGLVMPEDRLSEYSADY